MKLTWLSFFITCANIFKVCGLTDNQNLSRPCSNSSRNRRFVGGHKIEVEIVPFIASVQVNNQHKCGASILSKIFILTAAHCGIRQWYTELSVKVGNSNLNFAVSRNVTKIAYHNEFIGSQGKLLKNDIAVLMLDMPLEFGEDVKPIQLSEKHENLSNDVENVKAYGWGDTQFQWDYLRDDFAEDFKSADLRFVSKNECQKMISNHFDLTDKFCAISPDESSCPCFGDSGGPVVVGERQVGIVTGSIECDPFFPSVFTEIAKHRDWIDKSKLELSQKNRAPVVNHPLDPLDLSYNRNKQSEPVFDKTEVPFIVAILDKDNNFLCSGTIIGQFSVLTAARCANSEAFAVRSESIYWNSGGQLHFVIETFTHPQYVTPDQFGRPDNDIGLIHVEDSFTCAKADDELVQTCLPESKTNVDHEVVYGWGSTDEVSVFENTQLKRQVVEPISVKLCNSIYQNQGGPLSKGQVCTRHHFGICTNDIGSPLIMNGALMGIFSWSNTECADYRFPVVYSHTKSYLSWIEKIREEVETNERVDEIHETYATRSAFLIALEQCEAA
ncbi:hypothetical protein QAD02_009025 [Eretmocerus hayati]|uniref:Uncharacterized protein n=1 Tax=Eretmocerus hayati TaxID=131215 RepID=A0ACC2N8U9_9HYME|nr:hypothetical protein QAD02_009025 [Eretmocerus hayati]